MSTIDDVSGEFHVSTWCAFLSPYPAASGSRAVHKASERRCKRFTDVQDVLVARND